MKRMTTRRAALVLRGGGQGGGVLVMALFSVMTVLFLGAAFLKVSSSSTQRQVRSVDTKRAFYLAEAGVAEAYSGVMIGKTGEVGTPAAPAKYGDGLFWVEVTDHPDGKKSLESTGMCGAGRAVLSIVLEPGDAKIAALGVFAEDTIQIGSGTVIDSYDGRFGSYADYEVAGGGGVVGGGGGGLLGGGGGGVLGGGGGVLGGGGGGVLGGGGGVAMALSGGVEMTELPEAPPVKVSANGSASITEAEGDVTEVDGDLRPGPAQALTILGTPDISGATAPLPETVSLPAINVPGTTLDPGVRHDSAIPMMISNGEVGLTFLEVGADAKVQLQGPVTLVVDDLTVEPQGELEIDTEDGAVVIVVKDDLAFQTDSLLSNIGADPTDVLLLVAGTDPADLASASDFFGVVYAPDALVTVDGLQVYGSVIAEDIVFTGGAQLHYDQALADVAENSSLPQFLGWRIVDMASDATGSVAVDPFDALGVDPAACPKPSRAHADQMISVKYRSPGGATYTYDGLESGFDWANVKEVIDLERDGAGVDADVARAVDGGSTAGGGTADKGGALGGFVVK